MTRRVGWEISLTWESDRSCNGRLGGDRLRDLVGDGADILFPIENHDRIGQGSYIKHVKKSLRLYGESLNYSLKDLGCCERWGKMAR